MQINEDMQIVHNVSLLISSLISFVEVIDLIGNDESRGILNSEILIILTSAKSQEAIDCNGLYQYRCRSRDIGGYQNLHNVGYTMYYWWLGTKLVL